MLIFSKQNILNSLRSACSDHYMFENKLIGSNRLIKTFLDQCPPNCWRVQGVLGNQFMEETAEMFKCDLMSKECISGVCCSMKNALATWRYIRSVIGLQLFRIFKNAWEHLFQEMTKNFSDETICKILSGIDIPITFKGVVWGYDLCPNRFSKSLRNDNLEDFTIRIILDVLKHANASINSASHLSACVC